MKRKALFGKALLFAMLFLLVSSVATVNAFNLSEDDDESTHTEVEDHDEDSHEPEELRDDDGRAWILTDIMTVMLDPELPSFHYWYTTDVNGSLARFMVNFLMIVEFEDTNGDGVYQPNETLGFAPLDAFEWSLQTGSITNELGQNTEVYASYTKGGLSDDWEDDWFEHWIPGYDEDGPFEDPEYIFSQYSELTLQFYAHIYMDDYNGTVSDDDGIKANYTIAGGVELKVDVEIGNFPFTSDTSSVAVLNYLKEDEASTDEFDHHFRLHEDTGDEDHDSEDVMEHLGEEFEDLDEDDDGNEDDVQEISFIDASTDVTHGFYRWLDKAVITHLNGSQEAVDVDASYWTNGDGLLLWLAYPYFDGGSILHDPSVRLIESASPYVPTNPIDLPVLFFAVIGAVVLIAGIGIAIKRR
ncbi:MAG: hypothetical protein E3J86_12195 [Candidatus Thorarchaeota archaeon]|nr:MAG: hypothetical protein E3J86_12195 [Candidatus Thorarchaeota archaeon]